MKLNKLLRTEGIPSLISNENASSKAHTGPLCGQICSGSAPWNKRMATISSFLDSTASVRKVDFSKYSGLSGYPRRFHVTIHFLIQSHSKQQFIQVPAASVCAIYHQSKDRWSLGSVLVPLAQTWKGNATSSAWVNTEHLLLRVDVARAGASTCECVPTSIFKFWQDSVRI